LITSVDEWTQLLKEIKKAELEECILKSVGRDRACRQAINWRMTNRKG